MSRSLAARLALAVTIVSAGWILSVATFGGFDVQIGPLAVRSHRLLPAVIAFVTAAVALAIVGGRTVQRELTALPRLSVAFALAAALAMFGVAVHWSTNAAGGSDSYCYLSQARLLASGSTKIAQPWVASLPWRDTDRAAIPAGYTAAPGPAGTIAPMCPAGLALLMALLFAIAGERGMLLVVPVMGAGGVWLTYRTGLRITSRGAAACAAIIVAASPIVLYQVVQPMSDVPAMTLWLAAVCLACGPLGNARGLVTGLCAAAALTVRPNLLPLAAVLGAWLFIEAHVEHDARSHAERGIQIAASYLVGLLPGLAFVAGIQAVMHGSPFRSGYASFGELFRTSHALPNLRRYPQWLILTHTPAVLIGLVAPLMRVDAALRRRRWLLLAIAAANFACYVLYTPFDDWWYLRFMLPAIPCLILLVAAVIDDVLQPFASYVVRSYTVARMKEAQAVRVAAALAGVLAVVTWYAHVAALRGVFGLRQSEARFIDTGRYIARTRPETTMVLAAFQSGSVRYYSGCRTLAWDVLAPDVLDQVVDGLAARAVPAVIVLESWEEPGFRAAFAGHSRFGELDWPPRAQIGRDVRVYDPADRERYLAGTYIPTERVWIDERR